MASVKPKPQHFAVFELDVPKYRPVQFCQTQITTPERAVGEFITGKVVVCKVAVVENTIFVFAFCQRRQRKVVPVKSFVLYEGILHGSV